MGKVPTRESVIEPEVVDVDLGTGRRLLREEDAGGESELVGIVDPGRERELPLR
jgi:hypothetical protein